MHVLPQLRKLEHKYRDWLVVIGVHSSKFPNERETANIRNAIARYGIEHPVINDRDFAVWQRYAVRAWPTLMFIDPQGNVIGKHEGEFDVQQFDQLLFEIEQDLKPVGLLNTEPLPHQVAMAEQSARPLKFPGKIAADPGRGWLWIADSGHHRVIATDREGQVQAVVGCGDPGCTDGGFDTARFLDPQGLAIEGDRLYVADAGNHAIRCVDLERRSVETVAGTGEQSLFRHQGGNALDLPLNSPYDVALHDGKLYIAMAGFHQLWVLDLDEHSVAPFAGDGVEQIQDGPRLQARLAQPYGLSVAGDDLYFADSETSAVRKVQLIPPETVQTLVGTGLFDFGDQDGPFETAVLQHVQGVAATAGTVYVADTYNHKIRRLDLAERAVSTLAGSGRSGHTDGPAGTAAFNEPAGLALFDGQIYVADTNNHAIRQVDPATGAVSTFATRGL